MEEKNLYNLEIVMNGKYINIYVDYDEETISMIRKTFEKNSVAMIGTKKIILKN